LICIVGDTLHSKTVLSPESINIVYELLTKLSKISPVIISLGNHDVNLTNPNRMDALSPIIKMANIQNVHLLNTSNIYRYGNIDFYNVSIRKKDLNIVENVYDNNQTNIALYHGVIKSSRNDFGYVFESEISSEIFEKFDIAMLGDIHRRQEINSKKIQYCGSLIQQNYGEDTEKGYVIWDISDKNDIKSEFVKITNDNAFYTITTNKGKLPDLNITEKNPRIRLFLDRDALNNANEIIHQIKQTLNPLELTSHVKDETEKSNITRKYEVQSFYDTGVQNGLIERFLKDKYSTISNEELNNIFNLNFEMENILRDGGYYVMPNYGSN
jgi:DNA repair exonuclease SbcCD nuclease subunit